MTCHPATLPLAAAALLSISLAPVASAQQQTPATAAEQDADAVQSQQVEQRIAEQINAYRDEHDLPPLTGNEELRQAAQEFARYMADTGRYGHTADGRQPAERAEAAGYDYCVVLENIAYRRDTRGLSGEPLAEEFTQGWIESDEHRKNILNRAVTESGIAIACTDGGERCFAVQKFGRPASARLVTSIENRSDTPVRYRIVELERSRQPDEEGEEGESAEPTRADEAQETSEGEETDERREGAADRTVREFELPPRLIRKHAACVPSRLEILTFDASATIDRHLQLTVVGQGDSVELEQEELDQDEVELEIPDEGGSP